MFPCSNRDEHCGVADIFVKKGPYLKMYSTYIREIDKNVALLEEHCRKNPAFAKAVREFEVTEALRPVCSVLQTVVTDALVCVNGSLCRDVNGLLG